MVVALVSPLHELGDNYLFSAHMVQHLLMTLVAPPLLLLGTPAWLIRPLLSGARVLRVARFLTLPVVAFVLFNTVFALWHVPALYDLALRELGIHILEHLMFLGAGAIMWWPILSPLPELPRPQYLVQMLYLFVQPTVPSVLGALITFSGSVLYDWYAEAPRLWEISAIRTSRSAALSCGCRAASLFSSLSWSYFSSGPVRKGRIHISRVPNPDVIWPGRDLG